MRKRPKRTIKDNRLLSKKAEKDSLGQFRTIKDNEKKLRAAGGMRCIPRLLARLGGRANLADGLRVGKPARQQTGKSAVQKIRQQLRDGAGGMPCFPRLLARLGGHQFGGRPAGWETRETADWEVCGTKIRQQLRDGPGGMAPSPARLTRRNLLLSCHHVR
jgi:hypothetical protein